MTRRKDPKPTWVGLVWGVLLEANDFVASTELQKKTGGSQNQTNAALHHLQQHKAAEAVVGANGRLFWFATPESDTRTKQVEQRTPEDRPRRARRSRRQVLEVVPTLATKE